MRQGLFILGFILAVVSAGGFVGWAQPEASMEPNSSEILLGEAYLDRLNRELKNARDKVWVAMYVVSYQKDRDYSVVNRLIETLAKKYKQGLDVRVVLDASYEWDARRRRPSKTKLSNKNKDAYEALEGLGVPVRYDSLETIMHGKCVLLDEEMAFVGSHNWTYSALKRNVEVTVLMRSRAKREILDRSFIELWERAAQP